MQPGLGGVAAGYHEARGAAESLGRSGGTGFDLRKLDDVLQLVVAGRLARPLGERPPGAWS